jgi:hypothetical protein
MDITLILSLDDAATVIASGEKHTAENSADLVTLQSEIARDVSQELKVRLSGDDRQKLAKNYTSNAEAYRLYLQADTFGTSGPRRTSRKASNILTRRSLSIRTSRSVTRASPTRYSALSFNTFNPIRPCGSVAEGQRGRHFARWRSTTSLPRHTRRSGL